MRMFNVVPRLIKNTVKNLTHFTCNSPLPPTPHVRGLGFWGEMIQCEQIIQVKKNLELRKE